MNSEILPSIPYEDLVCDFGSRDGIYFATLQPRQDENVYFQVALHAHLYLCQASPQWADSSIAYQLEHTPASVLVMESANHSRQSLVVPTFPFVGPHDILQDGSFRPQNLPDLVAERLNSGWTIDYEDAKRLRLTPTYQDSE